MFGLQINFLLIIVHVELESGRNEGIPKLPIGAILFITEQIFNILLGECFRKSVHIVDLFHWNLG